MLYPIILCGGAGTRLWPLSTINTPKQFMPLIDEHSLFYHTVRRLAPLYAQEPIIACNYKYVDLAQAELAKLNKKASAIILEPVIKNTAPAIALAAMAAIDKDPDATLLVLPSDHVIDKEDVFCNTAQAGLKYAAEGKFITFGVVTREAHTGYGYIKRGKSLADGAFVIDKFVEKPDIELAQTYHNSSDYYWNSGMFLFRADCYLQVLQEFSPDIYEACVSSYNLCIKEGEKILPDEKAFGQCRADSIDYAVMEKTQDGVVLPLDAGWDDVGSYSPLYKMAKKDEDGNSIIGDVITHKTKDCYLRSTKRKIVTIGVKNLVVVETDNEVLIVDRDLVQEIKTVVG